MASVELAAFVSEHSKLPWGPGRVDCLLTLADWFVWRGFPDAAAHLRATYDSESGFQQLIADAGGTIPLVGKCAASIGLVRIDRQRAGCIGIIGSQTNIQRQFGAIWDGERWLIRADVGFLPMIARPLAIWDAI